MFRERQHKFSKSRNFRLFTVMPCDWLQTTKCNYFPAILGNFSSRLKLCVLMTICDMFTNVDTMVTTTQLLTFEVRIPSVSCPVLPGTRQSHGRAGTGHSCGIQEHQHIRTSVLVLLLADGIYNLLVSTSHFDFFLSTQKHDCLFYTWP